MLKAIRGFDPSFGTVFSTYAVPLITGEIRRFLRDDGMIKVSRDVKKNGYILLRQKEEFASKNGREPRLHELESVSGLSRDEVITALEACSPTLSLQDRIGSDEDGATIADFCADKDVINDMTEKMALRECLNSLSEEEQKLIRLRYYKGLTQMATAKILGMTQVKVSRTEKKILQKLRDKFL